MLQAWPASCWRQATICLVFDGRSGFASRCQVACLRYPVLESPAGRQHHGRRQFGGNGRNVIRNVLEATSSNQIAADQGDFEILVEAVSVAQVCREIPWHAYRGGVGRVETLESCRTSQPH